MTEKQNSGFIEKKHTADFSIYAWAADLKTLFLESAKGMFAVMELKKGETLLAQEFNFEIEDIDHESLLVGFLSEVLFLLENNEFFPDEFFLVFSKNKLQVRLKGCHARLTYKEIKAVTYHNLKIRSDSSGYSVTIVFDV